MHGRRAANRAAPEPSDPEPPYAPSPWQQQLARTSTNTLLLGGEGTRQSASARESQRRVRCDIPTRPARTFRASIPPFELGTWPSDFFKHRVRKQWLDGVGVGDICCSHARAAVANGGQPSTSRCLPAYPSSRCTRCMYSLLLCKQRMPQGSMRDVTCRPLTIGVPRAQA